MTLQDIIQQFQASGEIPTSTIGRLGIADDAVAYSIRSVLAEFSRACPVRASVDATGAASSVAIPGYTRGWSVDGVEVPAGSVPEEWASMDAYTISASGVVALDGAPGEAWRVHYRRPHTVAGEDTSLESDDLVPLFKLVASDLFTKLAAYHAETQKPEFTADSVNYQSKTREYLALAKAAREAFYRIVGISETAATIAPVEISAPSHQSWRLLE